MARISRAHALGHSGTKERLRALLKPERVAAAVEAPVGPCDTYRRNNHVVASLSSILANGLSTSPQLAGSGPCPCAHLSVVLSIRHYNRPGSHLQPRPADHGHQQQHRASGKRPGAAHTGTETGTKLPQ